MTVLGLTFEAAYGGGPLRQWNQLLWAMHCAELHNAVEDPGPPTGIRTNLVAIKVVPPKDFDPEGHSSMMLLDAKGNSFALPIPNRGLADESAREALIQTAISRLPSGPMVEPSLRRTMPLVGHDLLTAAEHWWHRELGVPRREESADQPCQRGASGEVVANSCLDPKSPPQVIWIGPRQQRAIQELRLDPEDAIGGEEHLKELLLKRKPSEIPKLIREMEKSIREHTHTLGSAVKHDAPGLYGGFARFKRSLNRASKEFKKSSKRALA